MQRATSKAFRLHIGFFGRRNVGKSSLLNAVTRQSVSIVSDVPGTTTDPVEKPMELLPLGPVLLVDTAGVDDIGSLGAQRIEKTRQAIARSDIAVLVTESGFWSDLEQSLLSEIRGYNIPVLVALNKADLRKPTDAQLEVLKREKLPYVSLAANTGDGVEAFKEMLRQAAPRDPAESPAIIRDLVGPDESAVLVIPIDREAPKGRILQAQAQVIRDLLDGEAACVVVQDTGLERVLDNMKIPPSLVVTDAQVFDKVARVTPTSVPITAFSILMSRLKGDITAQTKAVLAVETLRPGDSVLIAETCTHHPIEDDIGRVKIPRWLEQYVGSKINFTHVKGRDFPQDLSSFNLVIHCGACMWNRQEMMSRIRFCEAQGVPITNYGVLIAFVKGILERALEPFPAALAVYREARGAQVAVPNHASPEPTSALVN
jgi:[FeFe] hydrogenase H-cluster maturation GTPase HydF